MGQRKEGKSNNRYRKKVFSIKQCALEECGIDFEPKREWQDYCCDAHRYKNWAKKNKRKRE